MIPEGCCTRPSWPLSIGLGSNLTYEWPQNSRGKTKAIKEVSWVSKDSLSSVIIPTSCLENAMHTQNRCTIPPGNLVSPCVICKLTF
jgi:hypothetical protein